LWGNGPAVLNRARSPEFVARALREVGLPCPAVRLEPPADREHRAWLVKPLAGAGGSGIHIYGQPMPKRRRGKVYYQEYIEGESWSAAFVGDGRQAHLIGATRQLVGDVWLQAAPFHYCGSIGPMIVTPTLHRQLAAMGEVLVRACGLRGLFGVDGILRDEVFWPVEVNPRYTASMELLEWSSGKSLIFWHSSRFDTRGVIEPPWDKELLPRCIGKAILFAGQALTFPHDGPWRCVRQQPPPLWDVPPFGDIPTAGEPISAGRPVLTLYACADSPADCLIQLHDRAADLDRWLYRG
jgi:predicted ATP-grasp superfamily ATP-dependent carboligase